MTDEKSAPELNIRFLYAFCNDVKAVREFYSDVLGMREGHHMDDEGFGFVTYKSDGLELMFFRWDEGELPVVARTAWQPGDGAGELPAMSFSLHVDPDGYPIVVERLLATDAPAETSAPTWRQDSYWGLTVRDPMGHTIEVYSNPAERPAVTEWPES